MVQTIKFHKPNQNSQFVYKLVFFTKFHNYYLLQGGNASFYRLFMWREKVVVLVKPSFTFCCNKKRNIRLTFHNLPPSRILKVSYNWI